VVVTCALVSRMKADLTEDRFKLMVTELAKVFDGGAFDQEVFPNHPHAGIIRRPSALRTVTMTGLRSVRWGLIIGA
jgi:hypothetical protein